METQEFWSWPGLKRYFKNTGQFPQFEAQLLELEKLPMKDRKIIVQENGKDVCLQIFIDEETLGYPPAPYPSWTWNDSTRQWEPPVARPTTPKTEYDLMWNEDTQAWGLTGINLTRVDENGESVVSRKYFDTWDNLIEYLYKINTVKYVMPQILDQEKLELKDRKIITPHNGKFICLQLIG